MEEYIFVYGQFRDMARGLLKHPTSCGRATIKGKIYRVNDSYPGYIEGNGAVLGDIYLIDPVIFPELDEYEGEEYERVKVRTSTDLECWVYRYIYDVKDFDEIESGDWWLR